ncbi:hypothetical protein CGLO_00412 [Colletotrichum gloeosporioides Cg-14]|jgi:hypothetical protein
MNKS